jgi:hypothetical protein
MAEDHTQRPFRAADTPARPASERSASGGSDPLAELARLIGQNDPFGEFGRPPAAAGRAAAQPQQDYYNTPSAAGTPFGGSQYAQPGHDAPPMAVSDQPGYAEQGYDPAAHPEMHPDADPNMPPYAADEVDFYDDVPPRRRMGVLAIAAVFALAVLGTAGAVGYRALFGSSGSGPPPVILAETTPSKVVPADKKDAQSGKLIQDRVTDKGAGEKLVSREEQPIDMNKPAGVFPQVRDATASSGSVQTSMLGSGVIAGDPKKVRTIAIRPDGTTQAASSAAMPAPAPPANATAPRVTNVTPQPAAEPDQVASTQPAVSDPQPPRQTSARASAPAAARNGPLSLSPNAGPAPAAPAARAEPAPAPPQRTASAPTQLAPAPDTGGAASPSASGYAVQVSSRRSEADAQAAFRSLQSQFPGQLGGRQPLIRRVDLGEKGIYFRAMVGPFGDSDAAKQLCEELKAAGGSCFVQRI